MNEIKKVYSKFNRYDEFIKSAVMQDMSPGSISKALNALENDKKFSSRNGICLYMEKLGLREGKIND